MHSLVSPELWGLLIQDRTDLLPWGPSRTPEMRMVGGDRATASFELDVHLHATYTPGSEVVTYELTLPKVFGEPRPMQGRAALWAGLNNFCDAANHLQKDYPSEVNAFFDLIQKVIPNP